MGLRTNTPFLAFIPVVGDVIDAGLNYTLVVRKARQAEIPTWLLRKMLFNNTVSAAAGSVSLWILKIEQNVNLVTLLASFQSLEMFSSACGKQTLAMLPSLRNSSVFVEKNS